MERLESAVRQPTIKGTGNPSNRVLQKLEPSKDGFVARDRHAHDDIRVTTEVLCDRVDDDIGTQLERLLVVGAHESVVDHKDDVRVDLLGDPCRGLDVDQTQRRVRWIIKDL